MIRFASALHAVALLVSIISLFMLAPLGIALYNGEAAAANAFAVTMGLTLVVCLFLWWMTRGKQQRNNLRTREGFLMVTASWIVASALGALPFVLSGAMDSYADAYFETMSGFTTTGASILQSTEGLPRSLLFWRSLTHWLGGMGIVVLTVAILPFLGAGGMQIMRAESPGPTLDKIAPKITQMAKILWYMYLGLTLLETVLLMTAGMDLFDALTHTFGTLATGGFSPRSAGSIGSYNSGFIDWIITIFMIIAGTNFAIYYKLFSGNARSVLRNTEFKTYITILVGAVLLSAVFLLPQYKNFGLSLRYGAFQVASIMTTTGYATADFDMWPVAAKGILFVLMFVGGCSGSTSGGPKVIRIVVLFKLALNEMRYMARPQTISRVRLNGDPVKKDFLYGVAGFILLYLLVLLCVTLIVCIAGVDLLTGFSTALVTVGNIGPGFGRVGPAMNYAFYPAIVKWVLSAAMLIGRLEVYTVLILLTPGFWSRR